MTLYTQKPEDFVSKFDLAGAFIEVDGEILMLLRKKDDSYGNTWNVPAGKVENDETPEQAAKREIEEETGIKVEELNFFKKVYLKMSTTSLTYHIFHLKLNEKPEIKLDKDHTKYQWIKPEDALNLNLIEDEDSCIKLFYDL